ncbi:MAG: hypothetical protein ABRQ39_24135 [Candidatus Eremiobacterota bacterium]
MGFYILWDFFTLCHIKKISSPSENEIIDLRIRTYFRGLFKLMLFLPGFIIILCMFISLPVILMYSYPVFSLIILLIMTFLIIKSIKNNSFKKYASILNTIKILTISFSIFITVMMSIYIMFSTAFFAAFIFMSGMICFIKGFIFLFRMPSVSCYSLRARYIAIYVIIIILMVLSYNMCINFPTVS